ncbi:protein NYNRIN-like [Gossypium australe]|uniref:Protein NYNRIN-like n=1 Tax=Gossypium australe TaxID=47621 RepID=A0A5B6W9L8_9ROSI|nr:protein NYNRIN-like [Gossypium australe]
MPMSVFKKLGIGKSVIDVQKGELTMRALKCADDIEKDIRTPQAVAYIQKKIDRPGKRFDTLDLSAQTFSPAKLSIEEPPMLELKPLPGQLKYAYMGKDNTLPVVVSAKLTYEQEVQLLVRDTKSRLIRWIFLLQEFNLEIQDKKEIENQVANHLFRLEAGNEDVNVKLIKEDFLEEQLLAATTLS